jgi:hypothetical protein
MGGIPPAQDDRDDRRWPADGPHPFWGAARLTTPERRSETVPCPGLTWTSGPQAGTSWHPSAVEGAPYELLFSRDDQHQMFGWNAAVD